MKKRVLIFAMLQVLNLSGVACGGSDTGEYGYIFEESTGQNKYILVGGQRAEINFDGKSNRLAVESLYALKPSVLYANSDGTHIFLVGQYNPQSHSFVLNHWYIQVPFCEWAVVDETRVPHEVRQQIRHSLERHDFELRGTFDPNSAEFDPASFLKR